MASIEEHPRDSPGLGINNGHITHNGDAHGATLIPEEDVLTMNIAPWTRFHTQICFVAGVGFFTNAYNLFVINIVSTVLNYLPESNGNLTPIQDFSLKVAAPVGTILGALVFGVLADLFGRKRMYGVELIIIIVSTFAQALAGATRAVSLITALVIWRFIEIIMGVGIGGDYPSSAVIVSEYSPIQFRGRMMTVVIAFQGWGNLTASLVALAIVAGFRTSLTASGTTAIDDMWRLLIGLGCVPAVIALFFRLTVPETPRFTADVERNLAQAQADINRCFGTSEAGVIRRTTLPKASWNNFIEYFRKRDNLKVLFGVCYSWFAIDVSFYGLGLNNSTILQQAIFQISASEQAALGVYDTLYFSSVFNIIMAASLIPGYWVTFYFIDTWGRKPIQFMGFLMLAILFIITGAYFDKLTASSAGMKTIVFLYCLANFFQNFGPNTTTFIIPGELFPTRYRSTCHGIAAASGKLGATISLIIFYMIGNDVNNTKRLLLILGCFMFTGIVSTISLPDTKGKSLEALSKEEQAGKQGDAMPMEPIET